MASSVKFDWSECISIDQKKYPADMLEHAKYAEFLTRFLVSQGYDDSREGEERERNYVLNLNSAWGSGKSYFLRRWANNLKQHYPVVYVDAWQKDYSDDPLMTVISAIIDCLCEQAGKGKASEIKNNVPKKMLGLLKAAAPGAASAFGKRYLGIDPVALMNADNDDELGNLRDSDGKEITDENGEPINMGAAAAQAVRYLLDEHEAKTKAIGNLKVNVYQWVRAVSGLKGKKLPAFVFIDELDRCRPSYAVEMLEMIKHIFDIKGVVFVVATDTEQLQHAVRAVYGEGFDARVYLSRFFNSRFSLKQPDLKHLLNVHCDFEKIAKGYLSGRGISTIPANVSGKEVLEDIAVIITAFGLMPRTAIQIADRVIATISNMPADTVVDIFLLTFLLCLKERDNEIFHEVVTGRFKRKAGDKTVALKNFLEDSMLSFSDRSLLRIPLDPLSITERFFDGRRRDSNRYPTGVYTISLDKYVDKVILSHLGYSSSILQPFISAGGYVKEPKQTPEEKVSKQLIEYTHKNSDLRRSTHDSEATALWLSYIYIVQKFETLTGQEYQQLVDFASALDWLDREEIGEKYVDSNSD